MRVQAAGENGLAPLRHPLRHQHGFGGGSGAVVQRRVCHFHSGEQRDLRLEFEQVLQCALRDFRLIRCVGSQEFGALNQMVHGSGDMMTIGTCATEEWHGTGRDILRGHARERAFDVQLALCVR